MNILFKFFLMILGLIAKLFHLPSLQSFVENLPINVSNAKKTMGTNVGNFEKFVCCPCCSAIYSLDSCIDKQSNGKTISKPCHFVHFPLHKQRQNRKPCTATLMKTVRTSAGTTALYPRMLYYIGI